MFSACVYAYREREISYSTVWRHLAFKLASFLFWLLSFCLPKVLAVSLVSIFTHVSFEFLTASSLNNLFPLWQCRCTQVSTLCKPRRQGGKVEGRGGELRSPASSQSSSELSKAQELVVLSAWLLQLCVQHYGSCSCFTHIGASKDTNWDAKQKQTYPEPWHFHLQSREWLRQKHFWKSKENRTLHCFFNKAYYAVLQLPSPPVNF